MNILNGILILILTLLVPLYCRTSADLFKTVFDLLVSVTVFVGRFDMRMMQVLLLFDVIHTSHSFLTIFYKKNCKLFGLVAEQNDVSF